MGLKEVPHLALTVDLTTSVVQTWLQLSEKMILYIRDVVLL